jgi:hypothetical protein
MWGSFVVTFWKRWPPDRLYDIGSYTSITGSQSVVKNGTLYIDSGVQKWNGTDISIPIMGISSYMITIPLTSPWDWKTNITEQAKAKNVTNPNTGTLQPSQIGSHMFHGPADKPELSVYSETTFMGNQSFETYASPDNSPCPLWSYTYGLTYPWSQYYSLTAWMPNHGAAAEAIDQGLGFVLTAKLTGAPHTRHLTHFLELKLSICLSRV